jgi:hypothetical protein
MRPSCWIRVGLPVRLWTVRLSYGYKTAIVVLTQECSLWKLFTICSVPVLTTMLSA